MKKAVIILIFVFAQLSVLEAQDRPNSLRVGYGLATYDQIFGVFEDLTETIISIGSYEKQNESWQGGFYLSYYHMISEHYRLGGTFMWDQSTADIYVLKEHAGKTKNDFFTLALEIERRHLKTDWIQLYSGAGVGMMYLTEDFEAISSDLSSGSDNAANFTFQLNLLGVRIGNRLGFFTELGLGYKGIVNFGASVQF